MFWYCVVVIDMDTAVTGKQSSIAFKDVLFFKQKGTAVIAQTRMSQLHPTMEVHLMHSTTFMQTPTTAPAVLKVTDSGEVLPV